MKSVAGNKIVRLDGQNKDIIVEKQNHMPTKIRAIQQNIMEARNSQSTKEERTQLK